jgi:hypothetical protein
MRSLSSTTDVSRRWLGLTGAGHVFRGDVFGKYLSSLFKQGAVCEDGAAVTGGN